MRKINIKISGKAYKEKPKADDIKKITWRMKNTAGISVTYKELADIISKGHSVLLAEFNEVGSIKEDNIKSISCIALDVDSKVNKINIYEMISRVNRIFNIYPVISYCTFSDIDSSKFRLIYRLENKIDVETYRALYCVFQWKLEKYIDTATKNANRIWAGTNKNVVYTENDIPISFAKLIKMISSYNLYLRKKSKKVTEQKYESYEKADYSNAKYIKPEYKKEVLDYLINNIDLRELIPKYFGGRYKRNGERLTGACILHGGDNETALVIDKDRYTCFTHCGCGNVITIARRIYNIENFSDVVFKLLDDNNLEIPLHYVREMYNG